MNKKKQLAKNTLIIFFGRACTYFISFLLLPLYTSKLTTNDYGIVDLIQTYVTLLVPIITLELEMSIFRYLVDSRGNSRDTKKLISNDFYVLFLSLGLFSILYLIVTCFVSIPFRFLILIDIIVCVFSGNFLQVVRGFGRTVDYAISCIITGVFTIISNIVLICLFHLGAVGMITSMMLANLLGALYLLFRLRLFDYIDFKLVDHKLLKEMYKYSIPLVPNGISWWIVNVSDRSIISFILGASFNGIYAISNKFSTIISSLTGVFNLSWAESAALHINSPDRDEFFSDITNSVLKLFSALGVMMIAFIPFIYPLLINNKFSDGYNYIPFLVLGSVFNVAICLYSQVYLAKKLSKQVALTAIIGAIINIVINVLFIKKIGLYAAAISTTISYFVMMLYRHIDLKKYISIKLDKKFLMISVVIYSFAIYCYYRNIFLLNCLSLLVIIIYSLLVNKSFLVSSIRTLKNKIHL